MRSYVRANSLYRVAEPHITKPQLRARELDEHPSTALPSAALFLSRSPRADQVFHFSEEVISEHGGQSNAAKGRLVGTGACYLHVTSRAGTFVRLGFIMSVDTLTVTVLTSFIVPA